MTGVKDVPADMLIEKAAEKLKEMDAIYVPKWAPYVKTGIHKEKRPVDPDWWYTRTAAVLRKVYIHGPIGVMRLSAMFGGKVDRGSKRYHPVRGSRSIIQTSLVQLENAGLVIKDGKKGRKISPEGQKFLNDLSYEILKELAEKRPELKKYLSNKK
jgi:small subunit ribosomal protein S19e